MGSVCNLYGRLIWLEVSLASGGGTHPLPATIRFFPPPPTINLSLLFPSPHLGNVRYPRFYDSPA